MKGIEFVNWLFRDDENIYFDSGCTVYATDDVKKIIITLDVDSGSLIYASKHGFDTIITHHAVGKHYYQASKEIFRRADLLYKKGVLSPEQYDPKTDAQGICESMWSANKISVCSLAKQLNINLVSCHSIADELIAKRITAICQNNTSKNTVISELFTLLNAEYFSSTYGIEPHIYGECEETFNMAYCDISYSVPPSDYILEKVIDNGYDLLIVTAISHNALLYAKKKKVTVICINHLQADICAMMQLSEMISASFPSLTLSLVW